MRTLLAAVLLLGVIACGDDDDDDPVAPPETLTGVYTLTSANGAPLPWLVGENSTERLEVTAGTISFSADSRYLEEYVVHYTNTDDDVDETTNEDFSGTYTIEGATISFRGDLPGDNFVGVLDGDRITVTQGSHTLVFER